MSIPYVTLLVGSLNSTTIPSQCLVFEFPSLGEYLTLWWEALPYFTSVFLNFNSALITKFSPPLFPFTSGFLIKHVHVNSKFHFLLYYRIILKHASSGLVCGHSVFRVFFLQQPDFRRKVRLKCSSCPLDCKASGISSNKIASHVTSFCPNRRDIIVLSGPVYTNLCCDSG